MRRGLLALLIYGTAQMAWASDYSTEKLITGFSWSNGPAMTDCSTVPIPSREIAEASADQQAMEYCTQMNLRPQRISEFGYSENKCVWGGPQYKIPSRRLFAQALYICVER